MSRGNSRFLFLGVLVSILLLAGLTLPGLGTGLGRHLHGSRQ